MKSEGRRNGAFLLMLEVAIAVFVPASTPALAAAVNIGDLLVNATAGTTDQVTKAPGSAPPPSTSDSASVSNGLASASASATAALGDLSGFIFATAGAPSNGISPHALAEINNMQWVDDLLISPHAPAGPLLFQMSLVLRGDSLSANGLSAVAIANAQLTELGPTTETTLSKTFCAGACGSGFDTLTDPVSTFTQTFTGQAGEDLAISGRLQLSANVSGGSATIDFPDPTFFFDALTPGVTFTSQSGHDYTTPPSTGSVPEPASLGLFGAGFAGLIWLRRRSRKSPTLAAGA